MNLQSDDFQLFGVAETFVQDRATLDARWKELQREAHPDKFAAQGATAQRLAMQWSVRINEAYQRLKDPLKRAAYLCELHGAPVNAENNTAMPPEFLMQQMQWREDLEETTELASAEKIGAMVSSTKRKALLKCEHLIDVEHDFKAAAAQVRALMFLERFEQDLDTRIEQLEQKTH